LAAREATDDSAVVLSNLPATPQQRHLVLALAVVLLAAVAAVAPYASTPLQRLDSFIPALEATIFVNDLITSILLFAQYSIIPSRALLALAGGYLFTGLIAIPHALTFPGAFAPQGLFGTGLQTAVWLYFFWHLGSPAAVLAYAVLKDGGGRYDGEHRSPAGAIVGCAAAVVALVGALTWLAIFQEWLLPPFFADNVQHIRTLWNTAIPLILLLGAAALVMLWRRRRSVLDYWLMLVICAQLSEQMLVAVLNSARFTLGFYSGRVFSLITSIIVLSVLLAETTRLYTRLARSNMILERERNSKLLNVEAITASLAHEVRQPLTAIATNGSAALRFLKRMPPDIEDARTSLNAIVSDCRRASAVFDGIRALFRAPDHTAVPVDVNDLTLEVLRSLRQELRKHRVVARSSLNADLPPVDGNRSQLQQVVVNLIHNAVEAMDAVPAGKRVLQVTTDHYGDGAIVVSVQDSGPGIDPDRLDTIFDAFVTTKSFGMGLGLAICRMIIERHGGELTAQSDGKSGALFQFILPKAAAGAVAAETG